MPVKLANSPRSTQLKGLSGTELGPDKGLSTSIVELALVEQVWRRSDRNGEVNERAR
jgi:hypothetical protein